MLLTYAHKNCTDNNKFTVTFQTNDIQESFHRKKNREKKHT